MMSETTYNAVYNKFPQYGLKVLKLGDDIEFANYMELDCELAKVLWTLSVGDIKNWERLFQQLHSEQGIGKHFLDRFSIETQKRINQTNFNYPHFISDILKNDIIFEFNNIILEERTFNNDSFYDRLTSNPDIKKITEERKKTEDKSEIINFNYRILRSVFTGIWFDLPYKTIIDFKNIEFICTAGWGVFNKRYKEFCLHGGSIKFTEMGESIYESFHILEFDRIYEYHQSLRKALESCFFSESLPKEVEEEAFKRPVKK